MNTTTQAFQNKTADNIHSCTPCFYKPFNTKELLFYKKEGTAIQYVYSMTSSVVSDCKCFIYKGHNFTN